MKHLEQHNILTDSQHGFRAKRSGETQLVQTIHDTSKSLDKKETVDMAILDFTKAFDKVPRKRLIHKLKLLRYFWVYCNMDRNFSYRTDPTSGRQLGNIIIYHSYLRCTTGSCSWAATYFPSLHKRPTRQPIYKCTALCS